MVTPMLTAMNWPHGDQRAWRTPDAVPALAVHESHDIGMPLTTLGMGERTICLYSFQTIDERGARRSAEW